MRNRNRPSLHHSQAPHHVIPGPHSGTANPEAVQENGTSVETRRLSQYQPRGFTLIELLVVVTIIGILAAIAIPTYANYVLRSHRADARNALLNIQAAQEKYRTYNTTYAADTATLSLPGSTDGGRYSVTIANATANGYTATATADGAQTADTACASLILLQTGPDTSDAAKRECWSR